jgi:hypothetical protein
MALSKDYSRNNFEAPDTWDTVKIGALQRIADACELMAKNYIVLQEDAALYKRWYEEREAKIDHLLGRIASLKGVITKMKRKG